MRAHESRLFCGRSCKTIMARRLSVVENETRGFFDPVQLMEPLRDRIALVGSRRERTLEQVEKAKRDAISKRAQRYRKEVVTAFRDGNGHIGERALIAQSTSRHPLCIHAVLLRPFVAAAFPNGDFFLADEDVIRLQSRAPLLPERPVDDDATVADSIGDQTEAVDSASEHHCSISYSAPECEASDVPPGTILYRDAGACEPWWTADASDDVSDVRAPWMPESEARLLRLTLPFDLAMTLDPVTGLVRATDIATTYNKRVSWWLDLGSRDLSNSSGTRGAALALAQMLGVTPDKLAYVVLGGEHPGTWIHIRLMFHFAGWCHPPLSVHVNDLALRFYSGQLTTDHSKTAFEAVASSVRPVSPSGGTGDSEVARAPIPAAGQNRVTMRAVNQRARLRDTATPLEKGPGPFDVPHHLIHSAGVYLGNFGEVTDRQGARRVHVKVGKAVEQAVTHRVRDHYNERPYTFELTWMAGVCPSACWLVEETLKRAVKRTSGALPVPNTTEEWLVPVEEFAETHAAVVDAVTRCHASVLTTAADAPRAFERDGPRREWNDKVRLLHALIERL